jgi:hypothetical protein
MLFERLFQIVLGVALIMVQARSLFQSYIEIGGINRNDMYPTIQQ